MLRFGTLAAALMIVLAVVAAPTRGGSVTVEFGYRFANGETLSALAQGDSPNGDFFLVDRLVRAEYSGLPGVQLTHLSDFAGRHISMSGANEFHFFAFESDPNTPGQTANLGFFLSRGGADVINNVSVGTFMTSSSVVYNPLPDATLVVETFAVASYFAAVVVPEPSSLALLAVAGPILAVGLRLRRKAA